MMKGLQIACFTGCAILLACSAAVWASSSVGDTGASGLKEVKGKIDGVCIKLICSTDIGKTCTAIAYIMTSFLCVHDLQHLSHMALN